MTRSLTIVNTSNWEHEDYVVRTPHGAVHLKPGQMTQFTPASFRPIHVSAAEPDVPEPFLEPQDDYQCQLIPHVEVTMRGARRDEDDLVKQVRNTPRTVGKV